MRMQRHHHYTAHYRRRANPRVNHDAFAGTARRICDKGSRWSQFAFDQLDVGQTLTINSDAERKLFSLEANGVVRSEMSEVFHSTWPPECKCREGSKCTDTWHHTEWCYVPSVLSCSDAAGGLEHVWSEVACTPASPESGANHVLINDNVECSKHEGEVDFGSQSTALACAQRCRDHPTCKYFLFGNSGGSGRCWMEDVESDDCGPDGFKENGYNFYKLDDINST